MNDEQLEKMLRKAPAAKSPADLQKKLVSAIPPNRNRQDAHDDLRRPQPSLIKRWLPAFSVAVILLSCVVVLAIPTGTMKELTIQNATLREQTLNLETLRQKDGEFEKLRLENRELERLQKDHAELKRLEDEIAKLRNQLAGLAALHAENERLRSKIAAQKNPSVASDQSDSALAKAESIHCVSNMKQIGLAMRVWEGDNQDRFPSDYISMTNELSTWKVLQCPSDKSRTVSSWSDAQNNNVSYVRLSNDPSLNEKNSPNVVVLQCPIHGHVLLYDGSVQFGSNVQQHLQSINGVMTYMR